MNLVAMEFVLQVTVVELVLGTLDVGQMLSFELSRGTKVREGDNKSLSSQACIQSAPQWRRQQQQQQQQPPADFCVFSFCLLVFFFNAPWAS